jgi:type II secretory pathway pseudopilin PulG
MTKSKNQFFKKGMTLLETIFYVSVLGVTISFLLLFLIEINRLNVSNEVRVNVSEGGKSLLKVFQDELSGANYIITPKVEGSSSTILSFEDKDGQTVTFNYSDNDITLKKGQELGVSIVDSALDVVDFSVEKMKLSNDLSVAKTGGVRLSFKVRYATDNQGQEYKYVQSFEDTILLDETITSAPIPKSNLLLWLDAGKGITKDGSNKVSAWADQSGQGNNVLQGTALNQPLWEDNLKNGLSGVTFDGNDALNVTLGSNITDLSTVFVVYKVGAGDKYKLFELGGTNTQTLYVNDDTSCGGDDKSSHFFAPATNRCSEYKEVVGNFVLRTDIKSENFLNMRVNGQNNTTVVESFVGSHNTLSLGGTSGGLVGSVVEIIVYSSPLDNTGVSEVESYLNSKYRIYQTSLFRVE